MTKDELETLVADKSPEVRVKGAVLYNARAATLSAYNQDRSVANLRNYEAAEEALQRFRAEQGGGVTGDHFDNLAAVLEYLKAEGWKTARQSLYRHHGQGKILQDSDGKYSRRIVERYAKTFLKKTATGKRVVEETDELQRKKLIKEIDRLTLGVERDQFALEKERGLYIRREEMEIELAGRAGILVAGLKHWVQSRAAEWISAVAGDMKRTGELINLMTRDVDEHINHYAASREYDIVIEGEEKT